MPQEARSREEIQPSAGLDPSDKAIPGAGPQCIFEMTVPFSLYQLRFWEVTDRAVADPPTAGRAAAAQTVADWAATGRAVAGQEVAAAGAAGRAAVCRRRRWVAGRTAVNRHWATANSAAGSGFDSDFAAGFDSGSAADFAFASAPESCA